jgi:hypothetical protein
MTKIPPSPLVPLTGSHTGLPNRHRPEGESLTSVPLKLASPWISRWVGCLLVLGAALLPQAQAAAEFVATGSMTTARSGHTATLLANGKVLVAGGDDLTNPGNYDGYRQLSSAELYDPATGQWIATGSMSPGFEIDEAILLANGKVLALGGFEDYDDSIGYYTYTSSAEIYDPATGRWTATGSMVIGSMATGFEIETVTLLANGKVLALGSFYDDGNNSHTSSAMLYDPVNNVWSTTGSSAADFEIDEAILLANGKVLALADFYDDDGDYDDYTSYSFSAMLYDPVTGVWSTTDSPAGKIDEAFLLANGKVLAVGALYDYDNMRYNPSAELYDPVTDVWSTTGSLAAGFEIDEAILLANGKVLVVGEVGYDEGEDDFPIVQLYDPGTGQWSSTGTPTVGYERYERYEGYGYEIDEAFLLANGKVLALGGFGDDDMRYASSAELYDPATGQWSRIGSLAIYGEDYTATLLANGKVLVAGGYDYQNDRQVSSAELYQDGSVFSDDYFYSALNGTVTIIAYRGAGGAVTIPTTLGGLPVTRIEDNAFYGKTNLTRLTIPKGIASIGNNAFYGCTGLTSVTISDSVASIGNQAFYGCTGLTSVDLPEQFITDIEYIGLSGQVAATALIQGVGGNLRGNSAFITDLTNAVLAKTGDSDLSTKSDLTSAVELLASKAELATAVAPLASKADLVPYATKTELSTSLATLASKAELASTVNDATAPLASKLDELATNEAFVAALANNPAFLAALANQIATGPNQFGISIKQDQSLIFPAIPAQTYKANKTLKLKATSSAKLTPVTYESSDTAVATVAGNVVTPPGKGSATITASQQGNGSYNPATAVQVLTVK